ISCLLSAEPIGRHLCEESLSPAGEPSSKPACRRPAAIRPHIGRPLVVHDLIRKPETTFRDHARDPKVLTRLAITFSLGVAACLALAAGVSVPQGVDSARLMAASDDPVHLADLALEKSFNAAVATREIENALKAGDTDLARSFVELAAERQVSLDPALAARVEAAERDAASTSSRLASFARSFVTGKPEDLSNATDMLTD